MQERTGAVRLFFSGDKANPRTAEEIWEIGESLEFFEEGTHVVHRDNAAIAYTPRPLMDDAAAELLLQGSLAGRFTIDGVPPDGFPPDEGIYYVWVDYLDDRWVGRFVGGSGFECLVLGVEVKQLAYLGTESRHEVHSTPNVAVHAMGDGMANEQDWAEYQTGWVASGVSCISTIVCSPTT